MVLSKRERYVAAATIIAVAVLLLDRYLLTPFLDRQARAEAERQSVLHEMERATSLFARKRQMAPKWNDMLAGGLNCDASEAESQVLHAVRDWSQESSLNLSSVKPERIAQKGELQEIMFQVAATGPMSAVAGFLWRLETASLPIKVKELQVGSRKEGTDDLSVQLRISTLYLAAKPERSTEPSAGPAPEGDRR